MKIIFQSIKNRSFKTNMVLNKIHSFSQVLRIRNNCKLIDDDKEACKNCLSSNDKESLSHERTMFSLKSHGRGPLMVQKILKLKG